MLRLQTFPVSQYAECIRKRKMRIRQRVTLTRPVGSADGVIVGMSPTDFDRTQWQPQGGSRLSPCHRTSIPAVIAPQFWYIYQGSPPSPYAPLRE
jgi:hypothetical protein